MELALLQENLGAKVRLKPAEPMYPGSHCSNRRRTRTRVDVDPIHVALRETHIKNVLDVLGLGDHKCKSMPTPIVQTRQKSDEDEPRLAEEDRRAYHRCVGIFRYLLKYRPENAYSRRQKARCTFTLRRKRKLFIKLFNGKVSETECAIILR